jgi:hypothetical protein
MTFSRFEIPVRNLNRFRFGVSRSMIQIIQAQRTYHIPPDLLRSVAVHDDEVSRHQHLRCQKRVIFRLTTGTLHNLDQAPRSNNYQPIVYVIPLTNAREGAQNNPNFVIRVALKVSPSAFFLLTFAPPYLHPTSWELHSCTSTTSASQLVPNCPQNLTPPSPASYCLPDTQKDEEEAVCFLSRDSVDFRILFPKLSF